MAVVTLNKENVDQVSDLWLPDPELCSAQEELRRIEEWNRRDGSGTKKPSELGINNYVYGNPLNSKFLEGRNPPQVPMDSLENLEWYAEQLHRCIYGFEYKGTRITGDHYWFLNFTPFLVIIRDANGKPIDRDISFGSFAYQHDYIFKLIEEAHMDFKKFMLFGGRGFGKTYVALSIAAKQYYLKPHSLSYISASHSGHADEAFNKLTDMLVAIEKAHPTLALARVKDTRNIIKSGYETNKDGVKTVEGPMSVLQKVIYSDNPGVTRGSRPHFQLMEEVGDWSTGKGDLKSCIGASEGSWAIGSDKTCRVFLIGTGGSVASDQAKDVFLNPDAYDILAVEDFRGEVKKRHGTFIPSHYMLGGMGWERTGVNNIEESKKYLEDRREAAKDDIEILSKRVQEWPMTVAETFKKSGTNIFNQRNIAKQWSDIEFGADNITKPEVGFLEWKRSKAGKIVGVEFVLNPEGNVEIVEPPYKGESGSETYDDLYIIGVDSIDQGVLDSTSTKNRSSLGALVKKRVIANKYFQQSSNIYVAKFIDRSLDIRTAYDDVLKLTLYYNGMVNVEYSKIGIVHYFREKKQWHRFMKRPMVASQSSGDGTLERLGVHKNINQIGTTTHPTVIDHQDGKIKEYVQDYCHNIMFPDLLEQLRDYQREDRTKYDLVIAMGLCEIADEDLLGEPAKENTPESHELQTFGYYTDNNGIRRMGAIPNVKQGTVEGHTSDAQKYGYRWIDSSGVPRFDNQYDVEDGRDLMD